MSDKKLAGKVALVTGGNSGIGFAAAKEFKRQGASVVIAGRDEKTLFAAARELEGDTLAVRADVSKLEDIDRLIDETKKRFGRIDVLFANAGIAEFVPAAQTDEKIYNRMFDVNVKGLYFTVAKAIPLLSQGAAVVLTGSVAGEKGMPGATVYAATKAAVRSFARTFAAELVERGIRVNVLSPGPIETPIFDRNGDGGAMRQFIQDRVAATNPMKRLGTADEMAKVALFLASSDSSYMTGAEIFADGGQGQL
jgi:NAD(P)-dependent dehydrogenase (short-subunit alcohol dehydrogenase family)